MKIIEAITKTIFETIFIVFLVFSDLSQQIIILSKNNNKRPNKIIGINDLQRINFAIPNIISLSSGFSGLPIGAKIALVVSIFSSMLEFLSSDSFISCPEDAIAIT